MQQIWKQVGIGDNMVVKYSLKRDGNKILSDHFKVKEFACKDGSDEIYIDSDLVSKLELLRAYVDCPITITSGYRTETYNKKVGGADNSYHVKGKAADITCKKYNPVEIGLCAAALKFNGVIIYKTKGFTHVDTREGRYFNDQG